MSQENNKETEEQTEKEAENEEKTEDMTEHESAEEEQEELAEPMTQEDLEAEVEEDTTGEVKQDKKQKIAEFDPGDTIRVHYKIIEGEKTRIQPFEGIVISKKGKGVSKTFTVRRIGADGVGVERIFPLHSPNISKIDIKRRGKVKRAKLYYLRKKKGRAAVRVKDRTGVKKTTADAER